MTYAAVVLVVTGLCQLVLLWWAIRGLRRLDSLESRLTRLTDALALLTETSESGFRANATEIARMTESARADAARWSGATTRRVAGAVRRGTALEDIAAAEQVSEGEVRLRLHLAETKADAAAAPRNRRPRPAGAESAAPREAPARAPRGKAPKENRHGTVRA